MTEREAIAEIDSYAKLINNNLELSRLFSEDFLKICITKPNNFEQENFVKMMGEKGGDEIADVLIKKWF